MLLAMLQEQRTAAMSFRRRLLSIVIIDPIASSEAASGWRRAIRQAVLPDQEIAVHRASGFA
jgi:hypothetical protein